MTQRYIRNLTFSVSAVALAAAAPVPNGHQQILKVHRAPHAAPLSDAPDLAPRPEALKAMATPYPGPPIDVLTFHYDNNRTGWNQAETALTPASVGGGKFGLLTTLAVDGNVLAQPLQVSGYALPDGSTHDVLIVATGHDTVYAYDAQTYKVLWQVSLGTAQSSNDVGCGDVVPEYGISSTPVIVRASNGHAVLYVVAATENSAFNFQTTLHALDVGTGADAQAPVTINPSATLYGGAGVNYDAQNQWSRAGLAYHNGSIYIGIGSHCDNNGGSITGWLLRYNTSLALQHAFHTVNTSGNTELASIWMTGFAPAIDGCGNVFAITGNGDFRRGANDWGESVLRLPASLQYVAGKFTPSSYASLNSNDQDFGSGGIMLLPPVAGQTVPPLAVAMGKSAILYLLNQSKPGGIMPDDSGALQAITITQRGNAGVWGGPAYFLSPANGPTVYYQTDQDVLRAYSVATTGTPALTLTNTGTTNAGYGGATPVVSSNGAASGTGVVWLVRRSAPMTLEAYNADTLGAPIFTANAGVWSNKQNQNSFVAPMVADGRVYAPAYKTVKVFGLE